MIVSLFLWMLSGWAHFTVDASQMTKAVVKPSLSKSIDMLQAMAMRHKPDGLVVIHGGRQIFEYRREAQERSLDTMSVTKSVVALVLGAVYDRGNIRDGVDAPLSTWFPEMSLGERRALKLRHVLEHTSCIAKKRPMDVDEIYAARDAVALARYAPLECTPGSQWEYNNKAVNLLSAVVQAASGLDLRTAAQRFLFSPLNIHGTAWDTDAAKNPRVMAGLSLRTSDLAKLGELVRCQGRIGGKQIISRRWISQMLQPSMRSSAHGLLWWIGLQNQSKDSGPLEPDDLIWAQGWGNQALLIFPDRLLVIAQSVDMERSSDTRGGIDTEQLVHAALSFPRALP